MTKVDWKTMWKGGMDWEDRNRRLRRTETIIRRVERLADPVRRDDMTALCARVALRREAG